MRSNAKHYGINKNDYMREVDYDGMTYCFTTRTGAYVTRRNGKVSFQGNSSHYYNAPDIGITVYRKGGITEIHYWKLRFKFSGSIDDYDSFTFNIATSQYSPTNNLNDGSDKTKFKGQPVDQATIGRFISAGSS